MYDLIIYRDGKGNEPITEYIKVLGEKSKQNKSARIELNKILRQLDALKKHGTRIGEPITKHIVGDIWELRPERTRIFYFVWCQNRIILLHYFKKKTQKTPRREIEKAKRNMNDYIERMRINEKDH